MPEKNAVIREVTKDGVRYTFPTGYVSVLSLADLEKLKAFFEGTWQTMDTATRNMLDAVQKDMDDINAAAV